MLNQIRPKSLSKGVSLPPATLPPTSLASLVKGLRQRLQADGALPAERALAEQFEVKRHRLRQALKVLRDDGTLEERESKRDIQSGANLARCTNPLEVIELRLALEPALARLAAVRATPIDIARITRAASTPPGETRGAADLAFHKSLATASGNVLAAELYGLLRRVGTDARVKVQSANPACPARLAQRDAEHLAIARAIAARDPEAAERAMREHLGAVHRLIQNRLTEAAPA